MAAQEILILDASVVVKWFSQEPLREAAVAIRDDFAEGRVEIEVPEHLFIEVANALRYNPRFGINEVGASIKALEDMQLVIHRFGHQLAEEAIETAYRIGVTVYDAVYVALAVMRGATLYTADTELVSKADSEQVRHLSEYPRRSS